MDGSIVYWTLESGDILEVRITHADFLKRLEDPTSVFGRRRAELLEERIFCYDVSSHELDLSLSLRRFGAFGICPTGTTKCYTCSYSFSNTTAEKRKQILECLQNHHSYVEELQLESLE